MSPLPRMSSPEEYRERRARDRRRRGIRDEPDEPLLATHRLAFVISQLEFESRPLQAARLRRELQYRLHEDEHYQRTQSQRQQLDQQHEQDRQQQDFREIHRLLHQSMQALQSLRSQHSLNLQHFQEHLMLQQELLDTVKHNAQLLDAEFEVLQRHDQEIHDVEQRIQHCLDRLATENTEIEVEL